MTSTGLLRKVACAAMGVLLGCVEVSAQAPRVTRGISAEVDGILEVVQEDGNRGSQLRHFLHANGERLALEFSQRPPRLQTGARVRVRGMRVGTTTLALESGSSSVTTLSGALLSNTLSEQRTLVLLVNFQNNPVEPFTVAYAQDVVFNTASNHFRENSYQQTWLVGDTFGWFTIAMDNTVCDPTTLASLAQQAASNAGVNLTRYAHYVYVFPEVPCSWWGRGSVGGNPSNVWVNGDLDYRVVAHEMGHNFGLYHAHSLDCGSAVIGGTCTTSDYGDSFDMMGGAQGHFNAFSKELLGWMGTASSPAMSVASGSASYWLEPVESVSRGGAKGLKILKSTDPASGIRTWYYVEFRQAVGFDSFIASNTNVMNGVVIHTGSDADANSSYLLDMTPETASWNDPALPVGRTFSDATAGITITPLSADASGASVSVSINQPPPPPAPVAPVVQISTAKSSYSRGASVPISTVVSVNSAAVSGATVTFRVTRADGSTVTGSATTGSTGSATYTLQLRKKDVLGTYRVTATATVAGLSGSATTNVTVVR